MWRKKVDYLNKLETFKQGLNAWTASENDFDQQLTIDLGSVKNITRISTQGRAHSQEYVQEYHISYGSNGLDYVQYKAAGGEVKVPSWLFSICGGLQSFTNYI